MRCSMCGGEMSLAGRAPSPDYPGDAYVWRCPARECVAREVATRYPVVPPGLPLATQGVPPASTHTLDLDAPTPTRTAGRLVPEGKP